MRIAVEEKTWIRRRSEWLLSESEVLDKHCVYSVVLLGKLARTGISR